MPAVTIAVSQVSKLLGYEVQRSEYVYIRLYRMFRDIENTDWRTVLLAIENFVALYGLKELKSFLLKRKCVKRSSGRTLAIRSIPNALIVRNPSSYPTVLRCLSLLHHAVLPFPLLASLRL